jgi:cysteinyl-tRNA synthetase
MAIKIYNTLSREEEIFSPILENKVGIYQCGPTVYWTQHIGNMRSVVLSDLIVRTFKYLDYDVNFVRNITDVGHLTNDNDQGEDKMEKASKRDNKSPEEISNFYLSKFNIDSEKLNTLPVDNSPKATDHIQEMVEMIEVLIDKGYAYKTSLAIYFDISKAKDYTRLSKQNLDEIINNAGTGDITDSSKKNQNDFSLWFFKAGSHENAIQTWNSTWGEGFPGWHLECSAMSKKYLGDTFDIHIGGVEHISIHHTNEIAQSEAANGTDFVNYWMHNEHLLVDNGKMSKSEGTSYSLDDIIEKGFTPMDLRYFFLQAGYRSKQNFTWEALEASKIALSRLKNAITNIGSEGEINPQFKEEFTNIITDDFNIPQSLALVSNVMKSDISAGDKKSTILNFDKVLGLELDKEIETADVPESVTSLANKRLDAKNEMDFVTADKLRNEILSMGYEIKDIEDGFELEEK